MHHGLLGRIGNKYSKRRSAITGVALSSATVALEGGVVKIAEYLGRTAVDEEPDKEAEPDASSESNEVLSSVELSSRMYAGRTVFIEAKDCVDSREYRSIESLQPSGVLLLSSTIAHNAYCVFTLIQKEKEVMLHA